MRRNAFSCSSSFFFVSTPTQRRSAFHDVCGGTGKQPRHRAICHTGMQWVQTIAIWYKARGMPFAGTLCMRRGWKPYGWTGLKFRRMQMLKSASTVSRAACTGRVRRVQMQRPGDRKAVLFCHAHPLRMTRAVGAAALSVHGKPALFCRSLAARRRVGREEKHPAGRFIRGRGSKRRFCLKKTEKNLLKQEKDP